MQLSPGEVFAVSRQISDPYDTGTYYVQAEIRDARTDELIATINLEDKGSQRFRKEWRVCPDKTGLGRYITIASRVYDDAGYTTLTAAYGIEENEYLVHLREARGGGGGGGVAVDYKKIAALLAAELGKVPAADLQPLLDSLGRLESVPAPDLQGHTQAILDALATGHQGLHAAVAGITMPEVPVTDLQPVLDQLEALTEHVTHAAGAVMASGDQRGSDLHDAISRTIHRLEAAIGTIPKALGSKFDTTGAADSLRKAVDSGTKALERITPGTATDPVLSERAKSLIR